MVLPHEDNTHCDLSATGLLPRTLKNILLFFSSGTNELIQRKNKDKKKKRKPKLPKNYEPGATPDPERWLPKHERTGYRKKKDRRVKEVMKGSQGAATGASDL